MHHDTFAHLARTIARPSRRSLLRGLAILATPFGLSLAAAGAQTRHKKKPHHHHHHHHGGGTTCTAANKQPLNIDCGPLVWFYNEWVWNENGMQSRCQPDVQIAPLLDPGNSVSTDDDKARAATQINWYLSIFKYGNTCPAISPSEFCTVTAQELQEYTSGLNCPYTTLVSATRKGKK